MPELPHEIVTTIKTSDLTRTLEIIDQNPEIINAQSSPYGHTPLMLAVFLNDEILVDRITSDFADVVDMTIVDAWNRSTLDIAREIENEKVERALRHLLWRPANLTPSNTHVSRVLFGFNRYFSRVWAALFKPISIQVAPQLVGVSVLLVVLVSTTLAMRHLYFGGTVPPDRFVASGLDESEALRLRRLLLTLDRAGLRVLGVSLERGIDLPSGVINAEKHCTVDAQILEQAVTLRLGDGLAEPEWQTPAGQQLSSSVQIALGQQSLQINEFLDIIREICND